MRKPARERPILILGALGFVALAFTVFTPGSQQGLAVLESEGRDVLRISGATVAYQGRGSVVNIASRRASTSAALARSISTSRVVASI